MPKTFTSREFNQDTSGAKNAARRDPVFITDRGEPAFVLMSIDTFRRLSSPGSPSIVDLLSMPESDGDFDFEAPRVDVRLKPVDLTD